MTASEPAWLRPARITLVALLLSGCASTAVDLAGETHHLPSSGSTSAAAPTALPAAGELSSSCRVPGREGGPGELASVDLVAQGAQLVVAFTLAQPVEGDLQLRLVARPGPSDTPTSSASGFTLTTVLREGSAASVKVSTNEGAMTSQEPQDIVHVVGNEVHLGLPASVLKPLGPTWHWTAFSASGAARGQCPVGKQAGGSPSSVTVGS